jgi:hypothetical protein
LKALSYFEDGNLHRLPQPVRDRLARVAREVDLDHLPVIVAADRRAITIEVVTDASHTLTPNTKALARRLV